MTNAYYTPAAIVPNTLARSSAVNAQFTGVEAGFDKLPTEAELKQGKVTKAGADTGGVNAHVVALPYAPASYVEGLHVRFRAVTTNTGPSTINVNGLGVQGIRTYAGAALAGGEIVGDAFTDLVYDAAGGFFRIVNPVTSIATVTVNNNVKVSASDTTSGTLAAKLTTSGGIATRLLNAAGDEQLQFKIKSAAIITANTTIQVGGLCSIDTSGGAIGGLYLPPNGAGDAALEDGDSVLISDVGGALDTNTCMLNGNGNTIQFADQAAAATLVLDVNYATYIFKWKAATTRWLGLGHA